MGRSAGEGGGGAGVGRAVGGRGVREGVGVLQRSARRLAALHACACACACVCARARACIMLRDDVCICRIAALRMPTRPSASRYPRPPPSTARGASTGEPCLPPPPAPSSSALSRHPSPPPVPLPPSSPSHRPPLLHVAARVAFSPPLCMALATMLTPLTPPSTAIGTASSSPKYAGPTASTACSWARSRSGETRTTPPRG